MAFGTQGLASYIKPGRDFLKHNLSEAEHNFVRNVRMAWNDPVIAKKWRKKAVIASTKKLSKKKKSEVSLAPIGWGK